jgi:hypothetical protein
MAGHADAVVPAAESPAAAVATFATLPHAVALLIFAQLPVHTRLRAAAVCRAWRTTLLERSLWSSLDLSPAGGVPRRFVTDGLLAAAAVRAGNSLHTLDVSDCPRLTHHELHLLLRAHGATLRVLRMCDARAQPWNDVLLLLTASRALRECHVNLSCRGDYVAGLLGAGDETSCLRVHQLNVSCTDVATADEFVANIMPALASHASLTRLALLRAPLNVTAALDAVVDAALARGMTFLSLCECGLRPESLPSLARLLRGNTALTTLVIRGVDALGDLFRDEAQVQAFADALRSNATLSSLTLHRVGLWRFNLHAQSLLDALTGHNSIAALHLSDNLSYAGGATPCALIASLISANVPALTHLDVSGCYFTDGNTRPILMAAACSMRLRSLFASGNYMMDVAFMRDELLPAVRANSSLRMLQLGGSMTPHAREAEALVAARRRRVRAAQ